MEEDDEVPQLTTLDDLLAEEFGKLQRPNEERDYSQDKTSKKVPITILTGLNSPVSEDELTWEDTLGLERRRCLTTFSTNSTARRLQ